MLVYGADNSRWPAANYRHGDAKKCFFMSTIFAGKLFQNNTHRVATWEIVCLAAGLSPCKLLSSLFFFFFFFWSHHLPVPAFFEKATSPTAASSLRDAASSAETHLTFRNTQKTSYFHCWCNCWDGVGCGGGKNTNLPHTEKQCL